VKSKGQRPRSLGTNVKIVFAHIFVKSGSIYVIQRPNDQRSILHISSNTFHQRKCFVFVIILSFFTVSFPVILTFDL